MKKNRLEGVLSPESRALGRIFVVGLALVVGVTTASAADVFETRTKAIALLERNQDADAPAPGRGGASVNFVRFVIGEAIGAYYFIETVKNVNYQNDRRPDFGLPTITLTDAYRLGGLGPFEDFSELNAEKMHVVREAGLVVIGE